MTDRSLVALALLLSGCLEPLPGATAARALDDGGAAEGAAADSAAATGDAGADAGEQRTDGGADAAAGDGSAAARPPGDGWANWPVPSDAPDVSNYRIGADGTVLDLTTKLMWQQDSSPQTLPFDGARAYCRDLRLGAFDDWRLPTKIELLSILDFSRQRNGGVEPCIKKEVFVTTQLGLYWIATPTTAMNTWQFDLRDCTCGSEWATNAYVRCVR